MPAGGGEEDETLSWRTLDGAFHDGQKSPDRMPIKTQCTDTGAGVGPAPGPFSPAHPAANRRRGGPHADDPLMAPRPTMAGRGGEHQPAVRGSEGEGRGNRETTASQKAKNDPYR